MTEQKITTTTDGMKKKDRFFLVVDNDSPHLTYLSVLLSRFNYTSFKAASAREAIETAETVVPSLIILSLHLPDMHGYDLIQRLKEDPKTAAVPLITISGKEDFAERKRCLELGATGHLYRPVTAESLYQSVQVAAEKNPRSCMRIRTNLSMNISDPRNDVFCDAYTLDLSERGMYVRTMNRLQKDSQLSLQIDLNGHIVNTGAEVIYSCDAGEGPYHESGSGLRFNHIEPKDRERIRKFINGEITKGFSPQTAH